MSTTPLSVTMKLINDKLQFAASSRDNAPISIDNAPPFGDGQGYLPTELFLVSLMACSGSTIVSLLRKKRKTVVSFSMSARGFKREEHPAIFERVELQCDLVSPDATDEDMRRCIELTEEKYCPVWAMVKGNVEVECSFSIKSE